MSIFDGLADVFTAALGQSVTVTPAGGDARIIGAIFVARVKDDVGVIMPMPAIHARSVDVFDLSDGDAISVSGVSYVAREFRPDGQGMTTIMLEAA